MSSYVFANGIRMHYLHWGYAGDPPLLLLHGLASNARIWERVAPLLAEAGYRLLALDLRGHGRTDRPEAGYDFETVTADVAAFVQALDLERPVLMGHSWGAMVALEYASRWPEGASSPAALVLVDGAIGGMRDIPGATWEAVRERLAPPRLAGVPVARLLERLRDPSRPWQPDEQAVEIILANFDLFDDGTLAPRLTFERHMRLLRSIWEFDVWERYPRVACPVLMVPAEPPEPRSEEEALYLAMKRQAAARAAEVIPDLRVHWMPDTIHDVPLQRPDALAGAVLAFLREVGLGAGGPA